MGTKIMLLGMVIILSAVALSMNNIIAICGGLLGLFVAIVGLFKKDNSQT